MHTRTATAVRSSSGPALMSIMQPNTRTSVVHLLSWFLVVYKLHNLHPPRDATSTPSYTIGPRVACASPITTKLMTVSPFRISDTASFGELGTWSSIERMQSPSLRSDSAAALLVSISVTSMPMPQLVVCRPRPMGCLSPLVLFVSCTTREADVPVRPPRHASTHITV